MKKYIIFVDGVCSLCNRLVNFVNKFDSKNTFLFSSLQGETFKLLNQKHNLSSSLDYVVLYSEENENIFTEGKAILQILKELKYFKFFGYMFSLFPISIVNFFYRIIAKRRYQIFGKVELCSYEKDIHDKKILK